MARRKIADTPGEPEKLPSLTAQQLGFVNELLAGKTGADAYRAAYDTSNMQDTTVWVEASRLRHDPKVSLWLSAARKAHLGQAALTLDSHVRELERLKEAALESGNHGAAIQAEQLRGKACGFYKEQLEVTHHDPIAVLNEIALVDEKLARKLAEEDGIAWEPMGTALKEAGCG